MKPRRRSRSVSIETVALLILGLFVGIGVAGFVLLEAYLLLQGRRAAPLPATAAPPAVSTPSASNTPQPSATPLPTIPVETISLPSIPGGTISTTTGAVKFTLTTGATVFVAPETDVELTELPAAAGESRDVLLTLLRGRLLVQAVLEAGDSFRVQSPYRDVAEVVGSLMGVEFDPATFVFHLDCLEGHCRLGKFSDPASESMSSAIDLTGGQYSFQDQGAPPIPPQNSRNEIWQPLGGEIVPAANTPTPEPTPERASFCATFTAQFAGTPCP